MDRIKSRMKKRDRKIVPTLNANTDFSVVEAYKTIRTNLMFTTHNKGCKRIILTSAAPNEGKTTNCCNLGIALAQTNSRVLIIDCDLRKPSIHKLFKTKGVPGLSDVLAEMSKISEVIQNTNHPNLSLMCGGTIPPNPSELLSSAAMEELLNCLSIEYDYILMDTPPINVVSDSLVLSRNSDGLVMIVRGGETTYPELNHALASLKFVNAKILGFVLNEVKTGGRYGYSKYGHKKYVKYYGQYAYDGQEQ